MAILLDTHVIAWMTVDKHLLPLSAIPVLREASRSDAEIAIASTSLWEIAMMQTRGRISLPDTLIDYLQRLESMSVVLPITSAITAKATGFPKSFPRDPADRIIAATAVVHGMRLVTSDGPIRDSGEVDCVW